MRLLTGSFSNKTLYHPAPPFSTARGRAEAEKTKKPESGPSGFFDRYFARYTRGTRLETAHSSS